MDEYQLSPILDISYHIADMGMLLIRHLQRDKPIFLANG